MIQVTLSGMYSEPGNPKIKSWEHSVCKLLSAFYFPNYFLSVISYLSCGLCGPNFIPQVRFTEHAQTPAILPVQLESGNSVIRLPSQQDYRNTTQHSTTFPAVILLLLIKILANCTWMFGHKIPNMIKPPKVADALSSVKFFSPTNRKSTLLQKC